MVNEFTNEEGESNYGYLSGYTPGKRNLSDQIKRLKKLFPKLGDANQDLLTRIEKGEVKLPKNAEGWFAIPNWKKIAVVFGPTYSGAVHVILGKLKETRNGAFYNYREGAIDEKHLGQSAKSKEFWKNLAEAQGNPDILLVPAQFGFRHRGRSVRRARVVMGEKEVGLGAFAGGCMLLTHEERLQNVDDLWIDLSGDEFSPGAVSRFSWAPDFRFDVGRLEFDAIDVDFTGELYGSGSVFVP